MLVIVPVQVVSVAEYWLMVNVQSLAFETGSVLWTVYVLLAPVNGAVPHENDPWGVPAASVTTTL